MDGREIELTTSIRRGSRKEFRQKESNLCISGETSLNWYADT